MFDPCVILQLPPARQALYWPVASVPQISPAPTSLTAWHTLETELQFKPLAGSQGIWPLAPQAAPTSKYVTWVHTLLMQLRLV